MSVLCAESPSWLPRHREHGDGVLADRLVHCAVVHAVEAEVARRQDELDASGQRGGAELPRGSDIGVNVAQAEARTKLPSGRGIRLFPYRAPCVGGHTRAVTRAPWATLRNTLPPGTPGAHADLGPEHASWKTGGRHELEEVGEVLERRFSSRPRRASRRVAPRAVSVPLFRLPWGHP